MSTPARTPAAGLPGPVWPTRPVPPVVPGLADGATVNRARPLPAFTRAAAAPAAAAAAPAAPAPAPVTAPVADRGVEIPAEEVALDPRSIARASLAAGRNRSLWWTASGIAASVVVAFLTDAVVGTYALALLLIASAVVRGLAPGTGPVAVSVRSKPLDVLVLSGGAVALGVLASVLPTG